MQAVSRKGVTNVTGRRFDGLPILVPCRKAIGDGWLTFDAVASRFYGVRVFTDADVKSALADLTPSEKKTLFRLQQLLVGLRAGTNHSDMLDLAQQVFPHSPGIQGLTDACFEGLNTDKQKTIARRQLRVIFAGVDPFVALCNAVSMNMADIRLVVWWTGRPLELSGTSSTSKGLHVTSDMAKHYRANRRARFLPAIYCRSARAALMAYHFFKGISRLGICEVCTKLFLKRRSDARCCCPAHAARRRMKKMRHRLRH